MRAVCRRRSPGSAKPGLSRVDDKPYPNAFTRMVPRESGGGGLVSTLDDMVRLVQSLIPGGPTLLRPETINSMFQNQLPPNLCVRFPNMPPFEHRGFGLGSAVASARAPENRPKSPAKRAGAAWRERSGGSIPASASPRC